MGAETRDNTAEPDEPARGTPAEDEREPPPDPAASKAADRAPKTTEGTPADSAPDDSDPDEDAPAEDTPHEDGPHDDGTHDGTHDDRLDRDSSAKDSPDDDEPDEPDEPDEAARATGDRSDPPPRRRLRAWVSVTVSVVGEVLITIGVLLALFLVYSLWWTNVQANREAKRQSEQVREDWAVEGPGGTDTPLDLKDGIGFLHVPAMLDDPILVKPGTNTKELNQGVAGFYEKQAAMPWDQSGNFSLAAHRDGHGAKFHNIHQIDEGDPLVFETKNTWYVYKTYAKLAKTSKFNVDVLDPIPKDSGKKQASRYITLTTCTPIFTSQHRYIVWGELVRTEEVDADRTPPKELR